MEEAAVEPVESGQELAIAEIEQPYVGQWHKLVSTTNWEKGRIIAHWREALVAAGAPAAEHSDDAWSRRVGGVTGQHVGRLRRVFQRFGECYSKYTGLYWSHFQAALDWDDAEMWLEGASQSNWSVSEMRRMRWQTLGAVAETEPREEDVVTSETDEDYVPLSEAPNQQAEYADRMDGPPVPEGPDFGDEESETLSAEDHLVDDDVDERESVTVVTPFKDLAELPADFAEAFDAMKLAILRHKSEGWQQVACEDVLAALDALKQLALAPSADSQSA